MDYNNDGMKDLLVGEYIGSIRLFLNVNTDEDPVFNKYVFIKVGGKNLDVGDHSTVEVVDWNNDGKDDLVIGEYQGVVNLAINEGTPADPVYNSLVSIQDGSADLDVGTYSSPAVVDFNRDGKKDLLCGEGNGTLFYFENKGTDENPVFNGSQKLMDGFTEIDVGLSSRIAHADLNGDGVMDILCGSSTGYVHHFRAIGPLALSANLLSAGAGGSVVFNMDAGVSNGNRNYLMLGSVTGTEPGTPLPGGYATLPLNWDPYTDLVLLLVNSPVFSNFMGKLNAFGQTTAQLNAPPLPSTTVGLVMHYSYCLNNMFDYVSNPAAIEVVP